MMPTEAQLRKREAKAVKAWREKCAVQHEHSKNATFIVDYEWDRKCSAYSHYLNQMYHRYNSGRELN